MPSKKQKPAEPEAAAPAPFVAEPEAAAPAPFVAEPEVVVERAPGVELTEPPQHSRHYCVYPRDAQNPPANPAAVIQALKASFAGSNFTYFANR